MTVPDLGWNDVAETNVVKVEGDLIVSVSPMLFNHRLHLCQADDWGRQWLAGFCYDTPWAAHLAALAWVPALQPRPVGYKKIAFDSRSPHPEVNDLPCPSCNRTMLNLRWDDTRPHLLCSNPECRQRVDRGDL